MYCQDPLSRLEITRLVLHHTLLIKRMTPMSYRLTYRMLTMKKGTYITLCSLVLSYSAFAGSMGELSSLPDHLYYIGLGGNYNSSSLENQTIYGKGVNSAYTGAILTSSGSATGTSSPFYQTENRFSPHVQAGYLKYLNHDQTFWGGKFSYDYLNTHLSNNNMTIPQVGSNYKYATQETVYFTGNYLVESVQTSINHELMLLAYIGHSFQNTQI